MFPLELDILILRTLKDLQTSNYSTEYLF